jgi:hypothetical protein
MICSPSISKISAALLLAQKEISGAKKGATNPFFKMKYSDLGSVMEACKDAFNNHGISVIQPIELIDGINVVKTILLHESGEYITSSMKVSCKNPENPQEMGSAITYAKRYALQALAFIPSEDDDGEVATKPSRPVAEPVKTYPTPTGLTLKCEDCGKAVPEKSASFSKSRFGKEACFDCQKKLTPIQKPKVEQPKVEEKIEIDTNDLPF